MFKNKTKSNLPICKRCIIPLIYEVRHFLCKKIRTEISAWRIIKPTLVRREGMIWVGAERQDLVRDDKSLALGFIASLLAVALFQASGACCLSLTAL